MLVTYQALFIIMMLGTGIFWLIPKKYASYRVFWLVVISCLVIISYHLLVFLTLVFTAFIGLVFLWFYKKKYISIALASYLRFAIFTPLIIFNFIPDSSLLAVMPNTLSLNDSIFPTLGLSFYSLKLFISQKYFMIKDKDFEFMPYILSAVFLPSFVAGPIDSAERFLSEHTAVDFDLTSFLDGLGRIAVGMVKLLIIAPFCSSFLPIIIMPQDGVVDWSSASIGATYFYSILSFLILFFNFSGYSDIAIGYGKMLSIEISENFKLPLISNSIQNFWQRWHLSLSKIITESLFRPIVRRTGRPRLSLFLAFVIIGMWHKISLGYLIWGIAHGAAMAGFLTLRGSKRKKQGKEEEGFSIKKWVSYGFGIFLTISFVSYVSVIANAANLEEILQILKASTRF